VHQPWANILVETSSEANDADHSAVVMNERKKERKKVQ